MTNRKAAPALVTGFLLTVFALTPHPAGAAEPVAPRAQSVRAATCVDGAPTLSPGASRGACRGLTACSPDERRP